MGITQIRDDGKVNTLRTLKTEQVVELIKKETKAALVSNARKSLVYSLPAEKNDYVQKLPKLLPAATFVRRDGVMQMREYTGIVMLEVNHLAGRSEAERVKTQAEELPQTYVAFIGSSGRSVKIWVRFTYPDNKLPATREKAEVFHAHAYRLAVKYYQPQLSFDIELREPKLDQYCRLSFDPQVYLNPRSTAIYLRQPIGMPTETTYKEVVDADSSPMRRMLPGYESYDALSALFEAALGESLRSMENWRRGDDLKPLLVRLAENCFQSGIPEEDTVRWTIAHYYLRHQELLVRQTIQNVYSECKGFGKRLPLTADQEMVLRQDEFMKRRYEFRYNTLTTEVEYRERNSFCFYFRPLTERVQNSITLNGQTEGIKMWNIDVARYLHSDRVPIYQPVEEFLNSLPRSWDGKDRIRELADRVPCDNPHWRNLFYRWFLSMVAHWRGMSRNHANSTSPLLVGPQGYRKSTFCRLIPPPCLQAYYTDSIDFGRKRDAELFLNRFALINIDEFDQITPSQQAFLKHILQKPVVNTRRPNATAVQELRRYASFIATSNHQDLLTDTSGSRRFICINVTGPIDLSCPVDYEQLYAQAIQALYADERYWFDAEEEAILTEHNQAFEETPAVEQLFQVYFRPARENEKGEWLLAADILQRIQKSSKIRLSSGQLSHFGRILRKLGVASHRKAHGTYYFVMPIDPE